VLAAAVAAAVAAPLVGQVRNAQHAQQAPAQPAPAQPPAAPLTPQLSPPPVDPAKVIASSGDVKVTAGDFEAAVASLPAQLQGAASQPALRKRLVDRIIQIKLLAAEAKRRNLEADPKVKQQEQMLQREIDMQRDQILANALAQSFSADDAADKAYFDANKPKFDNMKARHILIRTPDSPVPVGAGKKQLTEAQAKAKADQIKQRLDKGEDFAAIAKAESDDTGSGLKGGDLGTFAPWTMDATFAKAAQGLRKDQISPPVKTQFGYHIIQLLDDSPRTYEQAKSEVAEARMNALMEQLKKDGSTTYDPGFFGDAANPGPTTKPASATGSAKAGA
jgi:parvulin-like peptidyl-prolyl isomerase